MIVRCIEFGANESHSNAPWRHVNLAQLNEPNPLGETARTARDGQRRRRDIPRHVRKWAITSSDRSSPFAGDLHYPRYRRYNRYGSSFLDVCYGLSGTRP